MLVASEAIVEMCSSVIGSSPCYAAKPASRSRCAVHTGDAGGHNCCLSSERCVLNNVCIQESMCVAGRHATAGINFTEL